MSNEETSRYVTVFHQMKETESGDRGDRFIALGEELDDRYKFDEEKKDFLTLARPIAIIDAGAEIHEDELSEWCNSHAGKAILNRYFPDIEPEDPTLRDVEELVEEVPA